MANPAVQPADNQDMSMEDILQSIRKIIAEDAPVGGAAASAQESILGSDVLELTEIVEDTAAAPQDASGFDILAQIDNAVKPEAATEPAPQAVSFVAVDEPVPAPSPAPVAVQYSAPEPLAVENGERLISNTAAQLSATSLKRMIDTHKAATPMPHFRNGTTLEELVLESLKPMLKDWLDANLPSMVERLVEREIRKLVE